MAPRLLFSILAEWLIFSATWIACCAVALCIESALILQLPLPPWHILVFVWASTVCQYNLHYLFRQRDEAASLRDRWSRAHPAWFLPAILLSGALAFWCFIRFSGMEILIVGLIAIISLLYSLPLLPNGLRLKQLGLLKPIILAAVWTVLTVWLPAHQAEPLLLLLVLCRRLVFLMILCLVFDVRDQAKDEAQGIRTVPVRWGATFTYRWIDLLLILFSVLALLVEWQLNRPLMLLALWISALVTKLAIRSTITPKSELYYLGILDGMMLLQAILVTLSANLQR